MQGEYFSKAWNVLVDDDQSWSTKHNRLVDLLRRVKLRRDEIRGQRIALQSIELDMVAEVDDVETLFSTFQRAQQRDGGSHDC